MSGNNPNGNELPDEAHVVRYIKLRAINPETGRVRGSGFRLRSNDSGLSVNWLECFGDHTKAQQLDEVRRLSRLTMAKNGGLAELNVGATKRHIRSRLESLRFIHMPLDAEGDYEADPSHREITGLLPGNSEQAGIISTMIAKCVEALHPAVNT